MMENDRSFERMIEDLGELYRHDPASFEKKSRQLIEAMIEDFPAPNRARAYGMQLKIDAELAHYKDPVARMNRMVEIFWEGVGDFHEVLTDPGKVLQERQQKKKGEPATVLPFRSRRRLH